MDLGTARDGMDHAPACSTLLASSSDGQSLALRYPDGMRHAESHPSNKWGQASPTQGICKGQGSQQSQALAPFCLPSLCPATGPSGLHRHLPQVGIESQTWHLPQPVTDALQGCHPCSQLRDRASVASILCEIGLLLQIPEGNRKFATIIVAGEMQLHNPMRHPQV